MDGTGIAPIVDDETAFEGAEFLGLARRSKRDPYRLALFARHFEAGERAAAVLPIVGGTLIVTDRRLLHFTTHLEVDGAWNVREFTGYTVAHEAPLAGITEARSAARREGRDVEESLWVATPGGMLEFVVSKGPEKVVSEDDIDRAIALLTRGSPSPR